MFLNKLKDIWLDKIKENPKGVCVIDVLPWLSRATLDIIGVAGRTLILSNLCT